MKNHKLNILLIIPLCALAAFVLVTAGLKTVILISGAIIGSLSMFYVFGVLAQALLSVFVSRSRNPIKKPPGTWLMAIVCFLYSPKDIDRTFKPILADWHKEYVSALFERREWKALWVNMRYRYRFAAAMGISKAWKIVDAAIKAVTSAVSR